MQEISSILFSGHIDHSDVLIAGMLGVGRRLSSFVSSRLSNLPGRMNKSHSLYSAASFESRHEVAIKYIGQTKESLMMTSECMPIPDGRYTLGQLLCNLYKRGDRWVDELDDSDLICTVNGRDARLFDMIEPGAEICISSRKSRFDA